MGFQDVFLAWWAIMKLFFIRHAESEHNTKGILWVSSSLIFFQAMLTNSGWQCRCNRLSSDQPWCLSSRALGPIFSWSRNTILQDTLFGSPTGQTYSRGSRPWYPSRRESYNQRACGSSGAIRIFKREEFRVSRRTKLVIIWRTCSWWRIPKLSGDKS